MYSYISLTCFRVDMSSILAMAALQKMPKLLVNTFIQILQHLHQSNYTLSFLSLLCFPDLKMISLNKALQNKSLPCASSTMKKKEKVKFASQKVQSSMGYLLHSRRLSQTFHKIITCRPWQTVSAEWRTQLEHLVKKM